MNWYIGQEIVCVKRHDQGVIKKGQIYTIRGLSKAKCKCKHTRIDVGITTANRMSCIDCNVMYESHGIWWFNETRFAPLADISELLEIIEKQPEKEKA